ncbi:MULTISPECIES: serine/threonine-protein kinase [Mesorhizobium]|uniref:Serine/threonine protein kinase n=1 Tax=Rhizobium loti TaxID=381 RepID=A0A6M7U6L3_RHILI|nr:MULTISPECIES: serine/threonine-protein kinase [Mesorhizobium]KRB32513.1 serine/threonine protein kinase [Mesorhizobium sp. Root172]OBQ71448.1 serine/threonine protein kinase [Mesorhizobium loti]QKC72974.1 serine/threonine protein kinase [Mesorhizobium loti]
MSADDKTRISPQVANTAVGTQLSGIYELDERIAFGGMGEVYRGHNIQTGDHVAIKIVLPEFARDQTILSLFRKEASILNHLSHDAVVRYHVFTIDPGIGRPYLAMEFVDGESLFDIMRRGPMPVEEVRKLCHRLASGLSAVHQAGAIHRDLSPDNIILPGGRVDRAKIIDFGIARSATVGGETLIGGKFAGKYNYVSPEQLGLYSGDVREQSDIYSLGLVLAAALRGKPIDMSGSQFEIIEKRRTVPDLADIDEDFRGIVEAMLQPDPRDRPVSMADIARMTRDEDEGTTPPTSITPRDRPGLPRAGQTLAPDPRAQPQPSYVPGHGAPAAVGAGAQPFVPHVRPALLSEPQPRANPSPPRAAARNAPGKPGRTRTAAIAAVAMLAVASGAGLYLAGFMTPAPPIAGKTSLSASEPSKPAAETAKPLPADKIANAPEPAKPVPPAQPEASVAPAENQPGAEVAQKPRPAKPAEALSPAEAPPKPPAMAAQPQTEAGTPSAESQADAKPVQAPEPAKPTASAQPEEPPKPSAAEVKQPSETASPAIQPDTMASNSQMSAPASGTTAPTPPAEKVATPPPAQPEAVQIPKPEPQISRPEAPEAAAPAPKPTASQTDGANAEGQNASLPSTKQPDQAVVALNVPKPAIPSPVDDSAQRVSWVRDFSGGDCFYATMTSSADKPPAIEGFGTAVQPFERMLGAFQAKFRVEPDISVRLIEQSQCEVTNFLRFLGQTAADRPQLVLDRTSVPDGTPIRGTLVTRGGLISSVLLIDHKGMVFNLDDRIVVQPDKATFSIPIGLGAADKATGKAVPQIIMVITGPQDIQAAAFSTPTPASVLLPKILEEIETDGSQFSATAKYFRLGG